MTTVKNALQTSAGRFGVLRDFFHLSGKNRIYRLTRWVNRAIMHLPTKQEGKQSIMKAIFKKLAHETFQPGRRCGC